MKKGKPTLTGQFANHVLEPMQNLQNSGASIGAKANEKKLNIHLDRMWKLGNGEVIELMAGV